MVGVQLELIQGDGSKIAEFLAAMAKSVVRILTLGRSYDVADALSKRKFGSSGGSRSDG